jgi:hypothetical protein
MPPQGTQGALGESYAAAALGRLGDCEGAVGQGAAYLQDPALKVYVFPLEAK